MYSFTNAGLVFSSFFINFFRIAVLVFAILGERTLKNSLASIIGLSHGGLPIIASNPPSIFFSAFSSCQYVSDVGRRII